MEMQKIAHAIAKLTEVATSGFSLSILPTTAGVTAYANGHESNASINYNHGDKSATDRIVGMLDSISDPLMQAEKEKAARKKERAEKVQAEYDLAVRALDSTNKKLADLKDGIACHEKAEKELLEKLAAVRSVINTLGLEEKANHHARAQYMDVMGEMVKRGAQAKYSNTQRPIGEAAEHMADGHIKNAEVTRSAIGADIYAVVMEGDTLVEEFHFPACRGLDLAYLTAINAIREQVSSVDHEHIKKAIVEAMQPGGVLYNR